MRIHGDALVCLVRGPALGTLLTFLLEPYWQSAYIRSGLDERSFFTLSFCMIHSILYFALNGAFLLCDVQGWLSRYKLPRTAIQQPSSTLILRTVLPQVVMQVVLIPLTVYYYLYPFYVSRGAPSALAPLPPLYSVFTSLLGCLLFNAVGFYTMHRLLHEYPVLYRAIHKQHHEYTGSIGFAAEYAHPVEAILANTIPTIGFGAYFGVHPLVFCVWLAWRLEETYEAHSGYNFSTSPLGRLGFFNGHHAAHHDYHHSANVGNYGGALLDGLFGTMKAYELAGGEEGQWAAKAKLNRHVTENGTNLKSN